jgi:nitrite reductase/ring-hydroxylating ferredoxin subunit
MPSSESGFIKVAELRDVPEGSAKAVKVDGRSVALFRHEGSLYATDNQCPHMGYPLTRGRVRNGVLTCDWHGWSYDMKGGGCFTGGCDDLDTFAVEVRDGAIYVDVRGSGSKRKDAHFLLLKEGLLSEDNWTLSKAIAIMLARGVSERDALQRVVRHLGRHIATERSAGDGGREVAMMVNGVKVARRYPQDDRIIPLMMAATGASGRAGDRPPVQPLPPPVTWEKLARWIRVFSADKNWEGIEKCLITARRLGGHEDRIVPLIYDCALEPFFLGYLENLVVTGFLAELLEEFGWDDVEELVCNLAAKILGRQRGAPEELRVSAIRMFEPIHTLIDELASAAPNAAAAYDEEALTKGLLSGDLAQAFNAISTALKAGVNVDRIATTMVLLAADRMARTPVNLNPGWGSLRIELILASSVRTALKFGGFRAGAKALYHAAWQFFSDRWLNIKHRSLSEPLGAARLEAAGEEDGMKIVLESIETVQVHEVGRQMREYLNAGFSADRLLLQMGQTILKDDNGWNIMHVLRFVFDEWERCEGHPARNQLLIGLARWATDVRKRTGSQSAAQTAQRFARGQTAVDLYES